MNKKIYGALFLAFCLASCGKNQNSEIVSTNESISSEEKQEEKNCYANLYSSKDCVYIYGVLNETFDLTDIDISAVMDKVDSYSVSDNEALSVSNNILSMKKVGLYELTMVGKSSSIKVYVSVNDSDQNRYNYPYDLKLEDYIQPTGAAGEIKTTANSLEMTSDSKTWNRAIVPFESQYTTNYTIECDASFLSAGDNTRWLGLIFRSKDSKDGYPYYQLDIRKTTNLSNSIELTYLLGPTNSNYTYLYQSSWNDGGNGFLTSNDKVHMKVELSDNLAKCYLSCDSHITSFEVPVATNAGIYGFSCANSHVLFENIKLSFDKNTKIVSNVDKEASKINVQYQSGGMKANIISSGVDIDEIDGLSLECQQYYAKAKYENNQINMYTLTDEKMDYNFAQLLQQTVGDYIPNIEVNDEQTLNKMLPVIKSFGLVDLTLWSSNESILDAIRKAYPEARLGYVYTSNESLETYDKIGTLAHKAGSHYANMIMIDASLLNKENVHKFDGIGYTVVANAKDGSNYLLLKGILSGATLVVSSYSEIANSQAKLFYDDTIFNFGESSTNIANQVHSMTTIPFVTGHRGLGTNNSNTDNVDNIPENTIESFLEAYKRGASAVELDVHMTADNKLAVIHDAKTDAYSSTSLVVRQSTLATLQSIPLKVGYSYSTDYHIPSLNEVFDAFNNDGSLDEKALVIEVKDNEYQTGVAAIELAKEKGWYNRISLITFNSATAKKLRDYDPGLQVGYLGTVSRTDNDSYWDSYNTYLSTGVGLASQFSTITGSAFDQSKARGQMYWLWTFGYVDSKTLLSKIFSGNRAFTTNYLKDFQNNYHSLVCKPLTGSLNSTSYTFNILALDFTGNKSAVRDTAEIVLLTDNATVNKNTITRTAQGKIYGFAKYKATWTLYNTTATFYIYSDLFEIN